MSYTAAGVGEQGLAQISFPIPLPSTLSDSSCMKAAKTPCQLHYIGTEEGEGEAHEKLSEEGGKKQCSGTYQEPHAANGNLCVFVSESTNAESVGSLSSTGLIYFRTPHAEGYFGFDSAVTAGTLVDPQVRSGGASRSKWQLGGDSRRLVVLSTRACLTLPRPIASHTLSGSTRSWRVDDRSTQLMRGDENE
jgi:hypothetical protein